MKSKSTKYFIIATVLVIFDQATKLYFKGFSLFGFEHQGL